MPKPYTFAPRVCVWCDSEYTPTGCTQKYCIDCKGVAWRTVKMEWWKKYGREYDKNYKRDHRTGPYPEAQYLYNDITEKTAFLDNVRRTIRARRGDMMGTKKLVKHVLRDMELESVSAGAMKVCYRAVEKMIVDEFKGQYYCTSNAGGVTFRIPKKKVEK